MTRRSPDILPKVYPKVDSNRMHFRTDRKRTKTKVIYHAFDDVASLLSDSVTCDFNSCVLEMPDVLAIDVFKLIGPALIVKLLAELLLDETDDDPADCGVPVVRPGCEELAFRMCIGISIETSVG